MMATIFQRLGPFEILREIGRGGMAQVFLALDTVTGNRVALRLLPLQEGREAQELLDAEREGAGLHERFSRICPHVPAVYARGTDWGYFFTSMEYIEGPTLSDVIVGPMDPRQAVSIAIQLCEVLELAHSFEPSSALIHGDLKPRNILITQATAVKVLDFGIAKAKSLSRKVIRNDFGTTPYLSPERLEKGEVDEYADLWPIGVVLYEMLSGVQPFRAADTRQLAKLIESRRPPLPLPPSCPVTLHAVVAKLLAPDQSERYGAARLIREDLERFIAGETGLAVREGWPRMAGDEPATRRTRPPAESVEEVTRRTKPPKLNAVVPAPPPLPQPTAASHAPNDTAAPNLSLNDRVAPNSSSAPHNASVAPSFSSASQNESVAPNVLSARQVRQQRWRARAAVAVVLLMLPLVAGEMRVASLAERLSQSARTQDLDGLPGLWSQYEELAGRSNLGVGVIGAKRALTAQTVTLAERVMANYRTPLPTVREAQWRKARESLARALAFSPDDRRLEAGVRYCDGHLHRINGEARKARGQNADAQQELTEAVTAFREAAELRTDWPDPFLGLARTFIIGLEDLDRGANALSQAQSRGYPPGERETTQLADGYRRRAETLARTAGKLRGMPQEAEYLARAADAYRESLTLYARVNTLDVAADIRSAHNGLGRIERQLTELSEVPYQ